nr:MAG TPA: hypothetical protein [Bacteriophage sp.]
MCSFFPYYIIYFYRHKFINLNTIKNKKTSEISEVLCGFSRI